MHIFLAIWFSYIALANSFILQDSYNILLQDSAHYKIEETIDEGDFEMIRKDQLAPFSVVDNEDRFNELNKLASKEYGKTSVSPINWFKRVLTTITSIQIDRTTTISPLTKHVHKRDTQIDGKTYEYNDLVEEYYAESIEEAKSNESYHPRKPGSSENGIFEVLKQIISNNSAQDTNNRFQAVKNMLREYKDRKQSPRDFIELVWKNTKICFYVFLAISVVMWCTKGWCFCCLPCKFFNPRRTMEEAKIYSMLNPPGVLIIDRKITPYEPTDAEKECFEKFQHLLRTL